MQVTLDCWGAAYLPGRIHGTTPVRITVAVSLLSPLPVPPQGMFLLIGLCKWAEFPWPEQSPELGSVCPALCWVILLFPSPWAEEYWAIRICHLQSQGENCSLHNLNWQLRVSSLGGKRAEGKKKDIGRETTPPHSLNLFLLSWKRCHEHWDVPLAL